MDPTDSLFLYTYIWTTIKIDECIAVSGQRDKFSKALFNRKFGHVVIRRILTPFWKPFSRAYIDVKKVSYIFMLRSYTVTK